MSRPTISCIVPSFNAEAWIGDTLASILRQTLPPDEVIVVDDGSTDGTADLAEAFGAPVRVIRRPNTGPAASRNFGVQQASGDLIAFLDHDDTWHPEKLERQVARFLDRPELDLCITHVQMMWSDDLKGEEKRYLREKATERRASAVPGYATITLLARRSAFDKIGMLDTRLWFGDATDWFLRAVDLGMTLEVMPDVLVYHRLHQSNLTRRRRDASSDEFLRIVKMTLDRRRASAPPVPVEISKGATIVTPTIVVTANQPIASPQISAARELAP